MQLTSFRFDGALIDEFVDFGYALYRDDARWIPPFRRTVAHQLACDYPFHRRPGNDHRHFLLRRGSDVIGRVTAMVNAQLHDEDGTPVGSIGFYECVDDPAAARVLLDAACEWLHLEHGLRRIWGPLNFDIWHSYRFMTRGFDEDPFVGEPANKPWYPDQFERHGFVVRQTWNTREIRGRGALESLVESGRHAHAEALGRGYRFLSAEHWHRDRDMPLLHDLVTRSFSAFLGYTPLDFADFRRLYRGQWKLLARPTSYFMFDGLDRPMGFAVTYLELSDAIRAMHGRENPLSRARFLMRRGRVQRLNLFAAGGIPEEQGQGMGLGAAALYQVVNQALAHGFEDVIFALMATDNRVQSLFRRAPGAAEREYALYQR
jgi:hypothetical protein